eukprot:g38099.t1
MCGNREHETGKLEYSTRSAQHTNAQEYTRTPNTGNTRGATKNIKGRAMSTSGKPYKGKPVSTKNKLINPYRTTTKKDAKGKPNVRDKAKINRLKMYRTKPKRDKDGKVIHGFLMSTKPDEKVKRIEPDRRWFGNTRVVMQKGLEKFREEMGKVQNDPYTVVMQANKVPMGLLTDTFKGAKPDLLGTESFQDTFGPKSIRKRPHLTGVVDEASLLNRVEGQEAKYDESGDSNIGSERILKSNREGCFEKGQSARIWMELYKVIDASDVLIQVLDARDPLGTRSRRIERELKTKERRHKHLILVLNKCDLVPTWVTRRWVQHLTKEYPTLAFHASITNSFGKGALIQLLRQFGVLHQDKKQISVGVVGYPNVGKSSIINTLRAKRVVRAAPIPGETKVWQYVALFRRIFLIDCPGVVYQDSATQEEAVLKGVVRVENIENPEDFVPAVLNLVKTKYIQAAYGLEVNKESPMDFLEKLCRKKGKLLKGGEPDLHNGARIILQDFQRGRLPFFYPPPDTEAFLAKQGESVPVSKPEGDSAEKKSAEGADENEKDTSEMPSLRVEQQFDGIRTSTKFDEEDSQEPGSRGKSLPQTHAKKKKQEEQEEEGEQEQQEEEQEEQERQEGREEEEGKEGEKETEVGIRLHFGQKRKAAAAFGGVTLADQPSQEPDLTVKPKRPLKKRKSGSFPGNSTLIRLSNAQKGKTAQPPAMVATTGSKQKRGPATETGSFGMDGSKKGKKRRKHRRTRNNTQTSTSALLTE